MDLGSTMANIIRKSNINKKVDRRKNENSILLWLDKTKVDTALKMTEEPGTIEWEVHRFLRGMPENIKRKFNFTNFCKNKKIRKMFRMEITNNPSLLPLLKLNFCREVMKDTPQMALVRVAVNTETGKNNNNWSKDDISHLTFTFREEKQTKPSLEIIREKGKRSMARSQKDLQPIFANTSTEIVSNNKKLKTNSIVNLKRHMAICKISKELKEEGGVETVRVKNITSKKVGNKTIATINHEVQYEELNEMMTEALTGTYEEAVKEATDKNYYTRRKTGKELSNEKDRKGCLRRCLLCMTLANKERIMNEKSVIRHAREFHKAFDTDKIKINRKQWFPATLIQHFNA